MTRSLLAIPALLVALVAGGCGEEAGVEDNSLAALDSAAERTTEVESLRQEISMEADFEGEQMTMEAEGSFTADSQSGTMTARMVTGGEEIEFEAIAVDGTMYLKGDAFPLPEGKEWFKAPDEPTSTMKPEEFVRFLRDSEGVENVGTEDIRGERTTHFRGPLDIEKLAEASDNEILDRIKSTPEAEDFDILVDVWVTDDGLLARMAMKVTAPENVSGEMTMTTEILEYDVPVNAEAPPEDTVADRFDVGG